jgi:hypothetical protein
MPGRGDRQKLGQSLDDTEDERLEKVEKHARLRDRAGVLIKSAR